MADSENVLHIAQFRPPEEIVEKLLQNSGLRIVSYDPATGYLRVNVMNSSLTVAGTVTVGSITNATPAIAADRVAAWQSDMAFASGIRDRIAIT